MAGVSADEGWGPRLQRPCLVASQVALHRVGEARLWEGTLHI